MTVLSEEALLKQVQSIIGDEIAGNITLSIKNEAHTDMDKFLQEKQRKIGIQIVMLVTVFAITLIILYFMMKTNVVTRNAEYWVFTPYARYFGTQALWPCLPGKI